MNTSKVSAFALPTSQRGRAQTILNAARALIRPPLTFTLPFHKSSFS